MEHKEQGGNKRFSVDIKIASSFEVCWVGRSGAGSLFREGVDEDIRQVGGRLGSRIKSHLHTDSLSMKEENSMVEVEQS
jgi:hypothetical protein